MAKTGENEVQGGNGQTVDQGAIDQAAMDAQAAADKAVAQAASDAEELARLRAGNADLLSQIAARDEQQQRDQQQSLITQQQREEQFQQELQARRLQEQKDEAVNRQKRVLDLMLVLDDMDQQARKEGHSLAYLIERLMNAQYGITVIPNRPSTTNDLIVTG